MLTLLSLMLPETVVYQHKHIKSYKIFYAAGCHLHRALKCTIKSLLLLFVLQKRLIICYVSLPMLTYAPL